MNDFHPVENVKSLRSLAQFHVVQLLWGTPFKGNKYELADHREKISDTIFKMLLPVSLKSYLRQGVILLEQAYNQAFNWEKLYEDYVPSYCLMNKNGNYFAPCYFSFEGYFNDVVWVKRFVQDYNKWIINRFSLACCYCFEEEIFLLWQQIKENGEIYFHDDLTNIRYKVLIGLWIDRLENKVDQLLANPEPLLSNFTYFGLIHAVGRGYEHATYYFWKRLPNDTKESLKEDTFLAGSIVSAAVLKCFKVVNFFQTQLSIEQKSNLLHSSLMFRNLPEVWWCLLETPFTHSSAIQEILNFPHVPVTVYANLLYQLAHSFEKIKLVMFKNAFWLLWQKISEEHQLFVLKDKPKILTQLINAKELNIVGLIIKQLPAKIKDEYLLKYGIEHIRVLSARREYELLEQYLCFFLVNFDKTSCMDIVRGNASTLLKSPIISDCVQGLPETEKRHVSKIIDALQSSQETISKLLDQTERHAVSPYYSGNIEESRI